jgi:hypothetical protein
VDVSVHFSHPLADPASEILVGLKGEEEVGSVVRVSDCILHEYGPTGAAPLYQSVHDLVIDGLSWRG